MHRTRTTALLVLVLAAAGCKDMGMNGNWAVMPEPDDRPSTPLVMAVTQHAEGAGLVIDGRLWLPSGLPLPLAESDLSPVGASEAGTVYARSWDRPPYGQVFTRIAEQDTDPLHSRPGARWQGYDAVLGRSGPSAVPEHDADVSPPGHH